MYEDQPIIPNVILGEIDAAIRDESPEDAVEAINELVARMAASSQEDAEAVARAAMVRLKAAGFRAKLTVPQPAQPAQPIEVRVVSLPDRVTERAVTRDKGGAIIGTTDVTTDAG